MKKPNEVVRRSQSLRFLVPQNDNLEIDIMIKPTIKVCGLTKLNQIQELVDLKVDFLGFIFYEKSPRYVLNHLSLEQISETNHPGKVGVFVNEDLEKIVEISGNAKLNFIQLHGDENGRFHFRIRTKIKQRN